MAKLKKNLIGVFILICSFHAQAQYKAVLTNLNTKKTDELKINDVFYFGTFQSKEKLKGNLEQINNNRLVISGKSYNLNELAWIDSKGRRPKKNVNQISRILLYFGGGMLGASLYEQHEANDKNTAKVLSATGAGLVLGAICFWAIPRQPKYNLSSKYLLETLPILQETK